MECECEEAGMPLACGKCSRPEWLRKEEVKELGSDPKFLTRLEEAVEFFESKNVN